MPASVLQGEVTTATMTITNRGRAAARDIYLKANVPWLYVGEPPSTEPVAEPSVEGASRCPAAALVGVTGSLMRVHTHTQANDSLAPDQSITVRSLLESA